MAMTVTPRTFTYIIGGLLAAVGFIALVLPISVADRIGTTDCGSALIASDLVQYSDAGRDMARGMAGISTPAGPTLVSQCADEIGGRRGWAWPLLVGGLVVVAGAAFVQTQKRDETEVTQQS